MTKQIDPRVAVSVSDLMATKSGLGAFSLPPSRRIASRLSGGHASAFKGRGLDFEEFRQYQPGDDVRAMDWLVTMKTDQPHVRVFQEEKDRSVVFCIDQSRQMFFSTVDTMKSVVAAQVMAACSWQVLRQGDRVGALVFDDHSANWFPAKRAQSQLLHVFRALEQRGNNLLEKRSSGRTTETHHPLNHALHRMSLQNTKGALIVLISDFSNFNSHSIRRVTQLKKHNELMCVAVQDPMEQELVVDEPLCLSDGEYQVAVDPSFNTKLNRYNSGVQKHQQMVKARLQSMGVPYLELDTSGEHLSQLRNQLIGRENVKKQYNA